MDEKGIVWQAVLGDEKGFHRHLARKDINVGLSLSLSLSLSVYGGLRHGLFGFGGEVTTSDARPVADRSWLRQFPVSTRSTACGRDKQTFPKLEPSLLAAGCGKVWGFFFPDFHCDVR